MSHRSIVAEGRSASRALVDALEPRRLLAGFATAINFQNKNSATPGGYNADIGRAFSTQDHGLNYGWDVSNVGWGIDRHTSAKQRYDTLAYFGDVGDAKTWEIEVPNGLYRVSIMSGDPKYTNSRYNIDAEGLPVLNSKPTKKTWYRTGTRDVFVSDGRLTITSGGQAKNNKINSINITQVDPHATGVDVVNPASNAGIVQNEVPLDVALPALKTLGMKTVRLWYDVKNWDDAPDHAFLDYFKAHHDAGLATVVIFSTPSVPTTTSQVYNFFARMVDDPVARASIDYWEIGNEPEHGFFPGTLQQYVQDVLKPAYEVLHLANEPVVGAAPTWDVGVASTLVSLGYDQYCDYANFHPYGASAEQVIERATQAKAIFGKPMMITEWNIQFQSDRDEWARQMKLASTGLAQLSFMSFYFALSVSTVHVGYGGVVNPDGTPNEPFYDVALGWRP